MSSIDAKFNGSIFRKSHPILIAQSRQLAELLPVRLAYDADGYNVGQTLARRTDGLFAKYDNGGSSGLDTAACFLMEDHPVEDFDPAATGTCIAKAIFAGYVYQDMLLDFDSAAKADVGGRTIIDATGINVLKF